MKKHEKCYECGETKRDVYQCIVCYGWYCEKCCKKPELAEHVTCLDDSTERYEE